MTHNGLRCSKCKETKTEADFFPSAIKRFRETGRVSGYCKPCQVRYYQDKGGSKYFAKWNRPRTVAHRQWFNDLKATLSCIYCGECEPVALDFHHRDPATKRFNISDQLGEFSLKNIKIEIAKCDVLCSNCHRKHHAGVPLRDVWQDYIDALPCGGALQGV